MLSINVDDKPKLKSVQESPRDDDDDNYKYVKLYGYDDNDSS